MLVFHITKNNKAVLHRSDGCQIYRVYNYAKVENVFVFHLSEYNWHQHVQLMQSLYTDRATIISLLREIRVFLENKYIKEKMTREVNRHIKKKERKWCTICGKKKNIMTTRVYDLCSTLICKRHPSEVILCVKCKADSDDNDADSDDSG